jgi:hypothetical protein
MPTPDDVPDHLKPASDVINTAQDVIDKIPSLIPLEPRGIFNSDQQRDRSDIRAKKPSCVGPCKEIPKYAPA